MPADADGKDDSSTPSSHANSAPRRPVRSRATERANRFRDTDKDSVEAQHIYPLIKKLALGLVLAALGIGLPSISTPPPAPPPVDRHTQEAIDGLGSDHPAALSRVVKQGTSALPALLRLLRSSTDSQLRRRAAEALDLVTKAYGGALRQPDADFLEQAALADPDPEVRAFCSAARARVSIFWR